MKPGFMRDGLIREKLAVGAVAVAGVALLLSPSPARAHHAFAAEFDANKPIHFTDATVTKVELINPHSWIHVDVKGPDGTVVNWAIEAGSPNILLRRGITRNTLQVGQKIIVDVSVEGWLAQSKRQRPHAAEWATPVSRVFGRFGALRSGAARR